MKTNARFLGLAICLVIFSCQPEDNKKKIPALPDANFGLGSKERPQARLAYENRLLADPITNKIPAGIHKRELAFARRLQKSKSSNLRLATQEWSSTGPNNLGGRTRGLATDVRDENIILAGGVSGGIWRSLDAGLSWTRTSQPTILNSVTALVQDTRIGKRDTWYFGTGELRGNSARAVGAPYRGDGIFKSTDGGQSWDILPTTSTDQPASFDSPFNYIWNLATDPTSAFSDDEVYAAIYGNIVRSKDGGSTWEKVLGEPNLLEDMSGDLNGSNASFYTNVMVTPGGNIYAYLSTFAPGTDVNTNFINKGIFHSTDGDTWTNITPPGFVNFSERLVMSYAPSNENVLYFLVEGTTLQLWKYQNGSWSNRSVQIPDEDSSVEAFDSQSSYNMTIRIHPNDPNVVFIGGTNLYRSTDGFATSDNVSQIGGYQIDDPNEVYSNHHPDQHELIFLSDGDEMLTANDGGIFKTTNNLAPTVSWISLNNGYLTSQFYSVALAKKIGGHEIIGGLQDNGSYLKFQNSPTSSWGSVIGGDGGYCASTLDNLYWYASFQEASIFKISYNSDGQINTWAKVDPKGITRGNYLFVTPFVLDPNNNNRMYLAGDSAIWRNDNLAQITLFKQVATSTNWHVIDPGGSTEDISALDISTSPAHILYYGTADGNVYRIEEANRPFPSTSLIFSRQGYVSNISIDPSDANRLLVAYSNYNITSLYFSSNGGQSFVDVGGNLEENTDGSGNGPSIRWTEIIPLNDDSYKYFAGTSIGLYSTDQLVEKETIWLQEGIESIGNTVVNMIDYRSSDGKVVVATHGNGVFESEIDNTKNTEPDPLLESLSLFDGYPNPFREQFQIHFSLPASGPLSIQVSDLAGRTIKTIFNDTQFKGDVIATWDGTNDSGHPVQNGIYHYIITYNGKSQGGKMILSR